MPNTLFMRDGKVLVDSEGHPYYCAECPCLPGYDDGDDEVPPLPGPTYCECCPPGTIIPRRLYVTGELTWGNPLWPIGGGYTCFGGIAPIVGFKFKDVTLTLNGSYETGWRGVLIMEAVKTFDSPIYYPPHPVFPHPQVREDDGTLTGTPCEYLRVVKIPVLFTLKCNGRNEAFGECSWGGIPGVVAVPIIADVISCSPFLATSESGYGVLGYYPPESDSWRCGFRECTSGVGFTIVAITE